MTLLIVIILALGAAIGCYQGAFKQIANLLGVVVGIIIAASFYKQGGELLASKCGASAGIAQVVAFVILVIIVPVCLGFVATLLTKLFSSIHLGFLNRLAGAVIGVVCYGLLLSFAFNVYDFVESKFGFSPEKLEQRENIFYKVKHVSQHLLPDLLIVDDSTEVSAKGARDAKVRSGVKRVVDKAIDKVVGDKIKSAFGSHGEETEEEKEQE
jgi:membrane protein required for colicin V production